jgi:hypothetical protein
MADDRENRVRDHAHALWEDEGRPEGRALDHWLKAESEADGVPGGTAPHPDEVDRAAGPSHGAQDFGGHDAEAEGAAEAGVGGQHFEPGAAPRQAGTDEPDAGERQAPTGRTGR